MRGSLLKGIRSREGRAHHTMAQHLQPLFEVKGHQCFIFDYKNLRLFHKYLIAPRTAKNTPLARTREHSYHRAGSVPSVNCPMAVVRCWMCNELTSPNAQ